VQFWEGLLPLISQREVCAASGIPGIDMERWKYRVRCTRGWGWFGHIRRNASIALALRRSLLAAGDCHESRKRGQAAPCRCREGVDSVELPALEKHDGWIDPYPDVANEDPHDSRCAPSDFQGRQSLEPRRADRDHFALGWWQTGRTLAARAQAHETAVLGFLRDVRKTRETVQPHWSDPARAEALHFTMPSGFMVIRPYDPVREYGIFDEVAEKVHYTLSRSAPAAQLRRTNAANSWRLAKAGLCCVPLEAARRR